MSNRPGRKIARKQTRSQHGAGHAAERQSHQQRFIVVGLVVVIAVGAAIGITASLLSGGDDEESAIAINGADLPAYVQGAPVDPAVGLKAPIFVTTDFEGNRIVTGSGGGPTDTAKVIGFYAHWCPHCQAELPRVTNWLATNELPERVEVLAVSTLEDRLQGNHPPEDWFNQVGWPLPVLVDSDSDVIATAYGLVTVPYFVVLDDFNTVLARTSGELDTAQFEALVALAESGVHS